MENHSGAKAPVSKEQLMGHSRWQKVGCIAAGALTGYISMLAAYNETGYGAWVSLALGAAIGIGMGAALHAALEEWQAER